jgi:acyl dehydratase
MPTDLATLFAGLPAAVRPAAAGWRATLRFDLGAAGAHLVQIDGTRVRVDPPDGPPPTCTLTLDAATAEAVLTRASSAREALGQGKLVTDNFGDLFRFDDAFGAVGGPASPFPVGKRDAGHAVVRPDDVAAWCAATDDSGPAYAGPGAVAPPPFHARLVRDLLFALMEDEELDLDLVQLLHAGHDVTFHRPLAMWDVVVLRGTLHHVEQKRGGLLVEGLLTGFVEGTPAFEARTTFFIRGHMAAPVGTGAREQRAPTSVPARAPDVVLPVPIPADQSHRYADVSLDRNPLHLDRTVAEAAGLPDVIVHGLCTMALSSRVLLDRVAFGDGRSLKRLAVRWTRPVFNDTTLTLHAWREPDGRWPFEVLDATGAVVVKDGLAVIAD